MATDRKKTHDKHNVKEPVLHAFSNVRRRLIAGLGVTGAGLLGACSTGATVGAIPSVAGGAPLGLDQHVRVSAQRLDAEVTKAFPLFNTSSVLPGFDAKTHGARNSVDLYRLTTTTTVPETGEVLQVTGLLALPADSAASLPVVSWQHGTIMSFDQVPSNLTKLSDDKYALSDEADSLETLLNIHRFAANGYAVIAADYVGKGPLRGNRGEGYVVKGVTTKTCVDMLNAGLRAMRQLGKAPARLFLHGWSQGAINTQWLNQELRRSGVAVAATAVASPFNDALEAWGFWTGRRSYALPAGATTYPSIPVWVSPCMVILLGSYELHYGLKGLIEAAVRPAYRQLARKYWNDYVLTADTLKAFPAPSEFLVTDFYSEAADERIRRFLQHLINNDVSGAVYDSPIRFHVGSADEAIHPVMVDKVVAGNPRFARRIAVASANHRTTFLAGLYGDKTTLDGNDNVLSWFGRV